eukprot:4892386-Pleurochrysis_carterae.AAC.1
MPRAGFARILCVRPIVIARLCAASRRCSRSTYSTRCAMRGTASSRQAERDTRLAALGGDSGVWKGGV